MMVIQKIAALDGLRIDSPERRKIVDEIEQLSHDYSDYFRVSIESLANQQDVLTLEGQLTVEGAELTFVSPGTSGFLESIITQHFLPDIASSEDQESEDEMPVQFGQFRIVFEQLSGQSIDK